MLGNLEANAMSNNTVSGEEALKPIFAVPYNELEDYICPIW